MAIAVQASSVNVNAFRAIPDIADAQAPRVAPVLAKALDNILVRFTDDMAASGNLSQVLQAMQPFILEEITESKSPALPLAVDGFNRSGVWMGKRSFAQMYGKRSIWEPPRALGKQLDIGALPATDQLTAQLLAPNVEDWIAETSAIETEITSKNLQTIWERSVRDAQAEAGGTVAELAAAITNNEALAQSTLAAGRVLTPARAAMLARTMTSWTMNEGSMTQFEESGLGASQWFATDDAVVRPWHWALHGKIISLRDPFVSAGGGIPWESIDAEGNVTSGVQTIELTVEHPPLEWNCRCVGLPVIL